MSGQSQFRLLGERRFGPFFLTQTFGALNDNVFKNALVILVTFGVANLPGGDANFYANLATGLFIAPFLLFSATAGQLAEKFDKARLIRWIKLAEIAIMALGFVGFRTHSLPLLFTVLALMGLHSTFFGPVKYAILPQHLREEELVGGNALVETATSLAVLVGTIIGGWVIAQSGGGFWAGVLVLAIAVLGWLTARFIPAAPPVDAALRINWDPLSETLRNLNFLRGNRTVFLSVLGISWFWFYGAIFITQIPNWTRLYLGGSEHVVTLLLTVFSIGVGIGSLLCERMSGRKVEIGLVPFGSIGLTLFGIDLYFAAPDLAMQQGVGAWEFLHDVRHHRVLWDLGLIGAFSGFYIVPLYALVQTRSEPSHRSRIIAGNNILNALFVVASALIAIGLLKAGLTIPQLLLTAALMNAAVAVFIYSLVPEFLMRFLVWLLINTLYRIDARGLDNIPEEGAAIVACNHVSFVDALIVGGTIRRPVRFIMYHKIFKVPVLNFIFRTARAIPIAPAREDEKLLHKAYDEIDRALKNGELLGIFPEGGLTPDGEIKDFKSGIERIIARTPAPVVPMALRGLWRSMWSRRDGRMGRMRLPRRIRARIDLIVDKPLAPGQVTAAGLEAQVKALRGESV
jgi:hypothetical protein